MTQRVVLATYAPGSYFAQCVEKKRKPKRLVRDIESGAVMQKYGREHLGLIAKRQGVGRPPQSAK